MPEWDGRLCLDERHACTWRKNTIISEATEEAFRTWQLSHIWNMVLPDISAISFTPVLERITRQSMFRKPDEREGLFLFCPYYIEVPTWTEDGGELQYYDGFLKNPMKLNGILYWSIYLCSTCWTSVPVCTAHYWFQRLTCSKHYTAKIHGSQYDKRRCVWWASSLRLQHFYNNNTRCWFHKPWVYKEEVRWRVYLIDGVGLRQRKWLQMQINLPATILKLVYKLKVCREYAPVTDVLVYAEVYGMNRLILAVIEDGVCKYFGKIFLYWSVEIPLRWMYCLQLWKKANIPFEDVRRMYSETPPALLGEQRKAGRRQQRERMLIRFLQNWNVRCVGWSMGKIVPGNWYSAA